MARTVCVVFCMLLAASGAALAQPALTGNYPAKPVTLIVTFSAGGPSDIYARTAARGMGDLLGQQFIVINRDGAGGVIGTDIVAKAAPDGYTLLWGSFGPLAIEPVFRGKAPYDAQRDFAPVSLFATIPFLALVHPSIPARNIGELVKLARASPGKLNYASAGSGGATHLAIELLRSMTKIDMVHVPYKGATPSITDLIAGQVDLAFVGPPSALPFVRSGRLRALATTGATRLEMFPEVPTMHETGVAGYEFTQWYGVVVPARTPREIIMALHGALLKTAETSDTHKRVTAQGGTVITNTPEVFSAYIKAEIEKATRIVRGAKLRAGL